MHSFLTDRQWLWVADRLREGYPVRDVAGFLGMHPDTVRRALIRQRLTFPRDALPPLSQRRKDFQALGPEAFPAPSLRKEMSHDCHQP